MQPEKQNPDNIINNSTAEPTILANKNDTITNNQISGSTVSIPSIDAPLKNGNSSSSATSPRLIPKELKRPITVLAIALSIIIVMFATYFLVQKTPASKTQTKDKTESNNNISIKKDSSVYQKAGLLLKKDHKTTGSDSAEDILKSIIDYNESRDPSIVLKYFTPEGLLAGYYYREFKYNDKTLVDPAVIEKNMLAYPDNRLNGEFGSLDKPSAQELSYYQGSDFYSRNSRYYAYSIHQTQKIKLSEYIGARKCGGGMSTGGYYNSDRMEKDSSGHYVATDNKVFLENVGLDPNQKETEFYASSLVAFYPGPQKQTGLVTTLAVVILIKNTQKNKYYLFDIADSSFIMGDQCDVGVTTNDYGTLRNITELEYIGKYYDLLPQT